jgi:hypothetical protein
MEGQDRCVGFERGEAVQAWGVRVWMAGVSWVCAVHAMGWREATRQQHDASAGLRSSKAMWHVACRPAGWGDKTKTTKQEQGSS